MSDNISINVVAAVIAAAFIVIRREKTVQHDSLLTGRMYVTELLKTANEARFLSACRMLRETFKRLLEACVTR